VDVFLEARRLRREEALLKKRITLDELIKHAGSDGKLDINEFALLKLQQIGKVTPEEVEKFKVIFREMDADGTGSIDAADIASSR